MEKWINEGDSPQLFETGYLEETYENETIYFIRSKVFVTNGGCSSMKKRTTIPEYFNKKVRLSGNIKFEGVDNRAVFFFLQKDQFGSFFSKEIEIKGTKNWEKYEIVMDYPEYTKATYGIMIWGNGEIWFAGMTLDTISQGQ